MASLARRWWPLVLVVVVAGIILAHPRKPVLVVLPLDEHGCITIPQGVMYSGGVRCLPRTFVPTPNRGTP